MSKPKVLIFAPREEPPETIKALEGLGCELVFGDCAWQLPAARTKTPWWKQRATRSR
jgi:hypothetical protein